MRLSTARLIKSVRLQNVKINEIIKGVIADALAEVIAKFDSPFFTKAVQFTVDQESGWSMEIDFLNFIDLPRSLVS